MTRNAKMTWPGEMAIEKLDPVGPDVAKARRRMERICATPDEIETYGYNPNGARNNLRPGIPIEDYGDYGDQRGGPGIDYTD